MDISFDYQSFRKLEDALSDIERAADFHDSNYNNIDFQTWIESFEDKESMETILYEKFRHIQEALRRIKEVLN